MPNEDQYSVMGLGSVALLCVAAVILTVFFSSGCGPSREDLEFSIQQAAAEELPPFLTAVGVTVTGCSLVKESKNKYTGVLTYSNGEKQNIIVTVDGDNFHYRPQ